MALHEAQRILQTVFGFRNFRPHQGEIIEALIKGHNALVVMSTGSGKSLCYQLPSIVRAGCGIVISPLIALMQNQVAALRQFGVQAAALNSSLDYADRCRVEQELARGELDVLYVAPERLVTESMLALLDRSSIALFAIDEAHCVSRWGHDFRPEYLQLSIVRQRYPRVPCIALTATADARTRVEIADALELKSAHQFITEFDRPNIRYSIRAGERGRQAFLHFLRDAHSGDSGIVYCLTRKKVDDIAKWLTVQGVDALPYHAGLNADTRQRNQQRFLHDNGIIIVATVAFGMGIDKPDVRFVAHLNLPHSIEAYYQETGRAGRDGLPADAWMSYNLQDVILLRRMLTDSQLTDERKRIEHRKIEALLGMCEMSGCRRHALLSYFDETPPERCGNCDNCLNPPESVDRTIDAQKALSCVYHTGQRFGIGYLIDVLIGKDNERIRRFGHDKISTFGIGREASSADWRLLFRQLIAIGIIVVEDQHNGIRLVEKSRAVLRGQQSVIVRRTEVPQRSLRSDDTSSSGTRNARRQGIDSATKRGEGVSVLNEEERLLFEAFREQRLALARRQGVPPYLIFHDSTLIEMARVRPKTVAQMAEIGGVGIRKLEQYADQFLSVIQAFETS